MTTEQAEQLERVYNEIMKNYSCGIKSELVYSAEHTSQSTFTVDFSKYNNYQDFVINRNIFVVANSTGSIGENNYRMVYYNYNNSTGILTVSYEFGKCYIRHVVVYLVYA